MAKYRIPPACVVCSNQQAREAYEARGDAGWLYVGKLKMIDGLVLTKRISEVEFHCFKCGWSRPDPILEHDGITKLWFVSCNKCGERHISTQDKKCASCDLGLL